MKKYLTLMLAVLFAVGTPSMALAVGEHGGKEHGGKEHGGKAKAQEHGGKEHGGSAAKAAAAKTVSKDDIRNTMRTYVENQSRKTGSFDIKDPDTGKTLNLSLERVHQRVGKTGDYYYSCADFKDINTGVKYDLDIDVGKSAGKLAVADVRIHKESGQPRYTYDASDNRIPLKETKSHLGSKGSPKEHGGKEHGGKVLSSGKKEHGGKEHGGKEHGGR